MDTADKRFALHVQKKFISWQIFVLHSRLCLSLSDLSIPEAFRSEKFYVHFFR